jgi:hypothetical protein
VADEAHPAITAVSEGTAGRPLTHLQHGFPERAQQGSVYFSRSIEAVSLKRREELPCFFLHRIPLGKERDGWKDEIVIFSNGYSK